MDRHDSADQTRLEKSAIDELLVALEQEKGWAARVEPLPAGSAAPRKERHDNEWRFADWRRVLAMVVGAAVCVAAGGVFGFYRALGERNAHLFDYEPGLYDMFGDTERKRHDYYDAPFRVEEGAGRERSIQNHRRRYEAGVQHRYLFTDCRAYERAQKLWSDLQGEMTGGKIGPKNPEVKLLPGGASAHYFLFWDISGEEAPPRLYIDPLIEDGEPQKVLRVHEQRAARELAAKFNKAWQHDVRGADGTIVRAIPVDWTRDRWDDRAPPKWKCP
jgi:hypothetical protein